jgi:hypothetical protein
MCSLLAAASNGSLAFCAYNNGETFMKTRQLDVRNAAFALLVFIGSGCTDQVVSTPPKVAQEPDVQELIGGFPMESPTLDAIGVVGSLRIANGAPAGALLTNCTGTLINADTVVTAKHCIRSFSTMNPKQQIMVFGIGSDASKPKQWVEVIEVEGAPGDSGGLVRLGHDVAVLHLAHPIQDVAPIKLASIRQEQVGTRFVSIGYGYTSNNSQAGERLGGAGELSARDGRTYEHMFGSFEGFVSATLGPTVIAQCSGGGAAGGGAASGAADEGAAGGGAADEGAADEGAADSQAAGAPSPAPVAPLPSAGAPAIAPPSSCAQLATARKQYESLLLQDTEELFVSVADGESQPCHGDSGGPLVQANDAGELVTYGVVSGGASSTQLVCDYGTIYASFGTEVSEFLEHAMQWTDPCAGLSVQGVCDGPVARRCSARNEGPRRLLEFNCDDLDLRCSVQADARVGCAAAP